MTPLEFCKSLRGVFGFPVTPFRRDLSLDLDGLARNVDEMARHPFCGMVAAGGTNTRPEDVAGVRELMKAYEDWVQVDAVRR
jgi:dihydrodipicolinate synthase/N-acetylneuraminate lyase